MMSAPTPLLWQYISTPLGLSQWFADDVKQDGRKFIFTWNGVPQEADLLSMRNSLSVKFHWVDDGDEKTFFELKIVVSELTDNKNLIVTDFADKDEVDEMTKLWNQSIDNLRRCLGCA